MKLRPFERRFLSRIKRPEINTAALSLPRGNGKSWLIGYLISEIMQERSRLFRPSTESILCASTLEQARIAFRFALKRLPEREYRISDSLTRIAIHHRATRTKLRVISSNAKGAFGLVDCPWLLADEPGAWEVNNGQLMHEAIQTSLGKPGSPLKVVYAGTLAPARSGWWPDLCTRGSYGPVHVTLLQGDPKKWDSWHTIRKCNPLVEISPTFRRQLLFERDEARNDPRKRAQFLSYRLNVPSADSSTVLLTVGRVGRIVRSEGP